MVFSIQYIIYTIDFISAMPGVRGFGVKIQSKKNKERYANVAAAARKRHEEVSHKL